MLLLPGLGLGLAGCAPAACTMPLAAVIPMTVSAHEDRLTVPVTVGGQPRHFMIDTGAEGNLVSTSALPQGALTRGYAFYSGIGGGNGGAVAQLDHLQLGRLHGGISAVVTDRPFTMDGHPVDGLIGMAVLGAYDVDIDVPDRQLRLYLPAGDCSMPSAVLAQPLYLIPEQDELDPRLRLRVQVRIDGISLNALIDSGAEDTALFRSAARRLGLTAAALAAEPSGYVHGVGHRPVLAHRHVLDAVSIADLTIQHLPVAVIDQDLQEREDVDMLLGMDFVRRTHLWISNSSHTVIVQFPPAASPPLPAGS